MLWAAVIIVCVHTVLMLLLKPLLNRIAPDAFSIQFRGPGWIFPLLYFRARDFQLMIRGSETRDRIFLSCDLVQFWISPIGLLQGKLVIWRLRLIAPFLEYVNRQQSYEKNKLLPAPGRFLVKRGRIRNGRIFVRDETRSPRYQMELDRIDVKNGSLDVGVPISLFFQIQRGRARLGDGLLEVRTRDGSGWLALEGTLGDVTSMQGLPFFGRRFHLELAHTKNGTPGRVLVEGQISGSQTDKNPAPFDFTVDYKDYRMTLDLGIQKLIENVIHTARPSGITLKSGVILSSRRFFGLIKKEYDAPYPAEEENQRS
jgi:hypothetical protein